MSLRAGPEAIRGRALRSDGLSGLRSWGGYVLVGAVLVIATLGALWPFLEPAGRRGVSIAAAVAYPIQVASLGLRRRLRGSVRGFLGSLAGGAIVRMGVVLAMGIWIAVAGSPAPAATLLGLAWFLVTLLLLEPFFVGDDTNGTTGTDSGSG